jgi:nickel-type superoxide dismutase maturation protease
MRGKRYHGGRKAILPVLALALTVWWWRNHRPFRVAVAGSSMVPTLAPGDLLVALARGELRRGTLVVVEHPERPAYEIVKRLVGLPGDEVELRRLKDGEYWVTGDSPGASTDSRTFGPVTRDAIRGVVRFRFWPLSRAALL